MNSSRLALAVDSLVHHAREEGIAYAAGGCVRDLDAEKRTEAARRELRAALPAEGATGAVAWSDNGTLPNKYAHLAHPAPADAGAACCQASRRGALEEAVMVAEHMGRGDVAARIRRLAQGGAA